jgi:hypothetical protein
MLELQEHRSASAIVLESDEGTNLSGKANYPDRISLVTRLGKMQCVVWQYKPVSRADLGHAHGNGHTANFLTGMP